MTRTHAPAKILILAADPSNQARLRLGREISDIKASLERSELRENFEIQDCLATRTDTLRQALLNEHPRIVHFCGHGDGADGLVLEDADGTGSLVETDGLANLFSLFKPTIECIVLNACFSAVQAKAIVQHVPHVVGMMKEIGDDAAVCFSAGFYEAIFAGKQYHHAFQFGRNAIQMRPRPNSGVKSNGERKVSTGKSEAASRYPDHMIPVLFSHPHIYVHCHSDDDERIEKELLQPLQRAGRRIAGDWTYRNDPPDWEACKLAISYASHDLVAWTNPWRKEQAAAKVGSIDLSDPKIRLLSWDDVEAPSTVVAAARYAFGPNQKRSEVMSRLYQDLGIPSEEVLTRGATQVVETLRKLMHTDDMKQAVRVAVTNLTRSRDNIGELNRWKRLHDMLHVVTVPFTLLEDRAEALKKAVDVPDEDQTAEERRRVVENCWRKVKDAVSQQTLPPVRLLIDYAAPPTFKPVEVPLAPTCKIASDKLETGNRDKDLKALRRGIELMKQVLGQWMPAVDLGLFLTAKQMPLDSLVQDLEAIGATLAKLAPQGEDAQRVAAFTQGIDTFRLLHNRLQTMVNNHNCLQTIDSLTSHLDDPDVTAEQIDIAWASVGPAVDLIEPNDGCLEELCRLRNEVAKAIAEQGDDDVQTHVRDVFGDFRSQLSSGFLNADSTLKKFCEELQSIRESLGSVIQEMQQ